VISGGPSPATVWAVGDAGHLGERERPVARLIAFWHVPRYSAGTRHGDDPAVDPLWQAVQGKVALVVNGHEHNMQRMKPRDGIVELIAGAGGHGARYPLAEDDARPAFADDDHDGALRMRLSRGQAKLDFVATGGQVLDSSVVRCREE